MRQTIKVQFAIDLPVKNVAQLLATLTGKQPASCVRKRKASDKRFSPKITAYSVARSMHKDRAMTAGEIATVMEGSGITTNAVTLGRILTAFSKAGTKIRLGRGLYCIASKSSYGQLHYSLQNLRARA